MYIKAKSWQALRVKVIWIDRVSANNGKLLQSFFAFGNSAARSSWLLTDFVRWPQFLKNYKKNCLHCCLNSVEYCLLEYLKFDLQFLHTLEMWKVWVSVSVPVYLLHGVYINVMIMIIYSLVSCSEALMVADPEAAVMAMVHSNR